MMNAKTQKAPKNVFTKQRIRSGLRLMSNYLQLKWQSRLGCLVGLGLLGVIGCGSPTKSAPQNLTDHLPGVIVWEQRETRDFLQLEEIYVAQEDEDVLLLAWREGEVRK